MHGCARARARQTDKYGRPVYYELVGRIDVSKVLTATTRQRFLDYHIAQAETLRRARLPACSAAAGRTLRCNVVVLDLSGFTLTQFAAAQDFLAEISHIDQLNFPGAPGGGRFYSPRALSHLPRALEAAAQPPHLGPTHPPPPAQSTWARCS